MKDLFVNPSVFFRKAKKEQDMGKALLVFIVCIAIGAFFSTILGIMFVYFFSTFFTSLFSEIELPSTFELLISGLTDGIMYPIIFLFAYVLLMLLSLYFFKTKTTYKELFIIDAYATAPTVLYSWIPIIGWIGAIVHYIYLLIIAGKEFYKFETKDSIIRLVLVPIGFAFVIGLVILLPIIFLAILVIGILGAISSI